MSYDLSKVKEVFETSNTDTLNKYLDLGWKLLFIGETCLETDHKEIIYSLGSEEKPAKHIDHWEGYTIL